HEDPALLQRSAARARLGEALLPRRAGRADHPQRGHRPEPRAHAGGRVHGARRIEVDPARVVRLLAEALEEAGGAVADDREGGAGRADLRLRADELGHLLATEDAAEVAHERDDRGAVAPE